MKFICTVCFIFSISDLWCDALRARNDYQRQWRDMNMHQSGSHGRNRDRFPNDMLRDTPTNDMLRYAPTRRNDMLRDVPTRGNWNKQAPQLDELLDEDELNNIGKMESRHPINQRDQIRFPSNQRQDILYPANQHDELRFPTNQRDEFQYPMNQGDDGLNSRRHDYYQGPVPFARDYYNNQGKNYRRAYPYQDFSTVKDEKPHRFYPFDKVLSDASEQLKRHGQPLNTLKDLSRVMGDHGLPNPNSRKYHNDFLENPEETDNEDQSPLVMAKLKMKDLGELATKRSIARELDSTVKNTTFPTIVNLKQLQLYMLKKLITYNHDKVKQYLRIIVTDLLYADNTMVSKHFTVPQQRSGNNFTDNYFGVLLEKISAYQVKQITSLKKIIMYLVYNDFFAV